jgi:hypothetical protein
MQIPDAPPAGYVPLSTAFERFCELRKAGVAEMREIGKRETEAEWAARQSADAKLCDDFLQALRCGRLKAIVCHPFTRERMPIPSEAWVTASLPTLPLWARVISGREGDGFLAYAGRTPFISEDQLSAILGAGGNTLSRPPTPPPRGRYPWAHCLTAFRERVAEEGAPTMEGGEPGWQTQADVARWICGWMARKCNEEPSWSRAKARAKAFMYSIAEGSQGS